MIVFVFILILFKRQQHKLQKLRAKCPFTISKMFFNEGQEASTRQQENK